MNYFTKGANELIELKIDPEFKNLLPSPTNEEYIQLEKNIVENGFDKNFPIMEWNGFIADGHNRYFICKKHNIEPIIGTLGYKTKEEVIEWMFRIQLGRRNLSPIQRIAVIEKRRSYFDKQARENLSLGGRNGGLSNSSKPSQNSSKAISPENKIDVRAKLAKLAGVSTDTYSKGKKILDSDNEKVKEKVLSGKMSINAGYNKIKEISKQKENTNNISTDQTQTNQNKSCKSKVSEETKQICTDLKTEKSKEYLDSIWDYKISIIECMNADFKMYYDGFVSTLNDMENRVTQNELDECIKNAEQNIEKLLDAIDTAKNTTLKMED